MIRFNSKTNTLILKLPRWKDWRVLAAVVFLLLVNVLVSYVDQPLAEGMKSLDPAIITLFGAITKAGDSKYWLVPLAMMLPFIYAARQAVAEGSVKRILSWSGQAVIFVFTTIAVSGILNNIVKIVVGRTRPRLWFTDGLYGFAPFSFGESVYQSFPSGHTNTAFALALALSFFWPRLRWAFFTFAVTIAASRVIITAHYLSDVIGGALLAIFITLWMRKFFAEKGWVFIRRGGEFRLAAPGFLLGQKIRAFLWESLGLPDGARGRLP